MNALAAAAPNLSDPNQRAGLLVSSSLSTASASAALSANGFLILMNALLGAVDSSNAYEDATAAQPRTEPQTASANALYPPASNADIAQVLIRSMLGGKTTPNTPVAARAKTAQAKARQPAGVQGLSLFAVSAALPPLAPASIPEAVPVDGPLAKAAIIAGLVPPARSGLGNQEPEGTGGGSAQSVTAAVAGAMASGPLAFGARLTPLETGGAGNPRAKSAPADLPAGNSSDAKSKAVTLESPRPHVLLRNETSDAGLPVADIAGARPANAFGTVADALRASETSSHDGSHTAAAVTKSPVQKIAVHIAQPGMPVVHLQVTERAGEIHVAVQTSDPSLEALLRQDLGTLRTSLNRAGYRAETYVPVAHDEAPKTGASPQMEVGGEGRHRGRDLRAAIRANPHTASTSGNAIATTTHKTGSTKWRNSDEPDQPVAGVTHHDDSV